MKEFKLWLLDCEYYWDSFPRWIATILLWIILFSCSGDKIQNPTISYKAYTTIWGNAMPSGICRFGYREYENSELMFIEDSCKFYKVGDMINSQTKGE